MTTFFLLRHGQTAWNAEKRIQGRTDTGLSPEGLAMAESWAGSLADLELTHILASDLARAVRTAEIVGAGRDLPLARDPRLAEQDWGEWTGLSGPELKTLGKELARCEKKGFGFRPPGGESREEVLFRACDALLDFAAENPAARALVVTHNGVIKCLLAALSGQEFLPGDPPLPGGYRVHRIECFENELALGGSGPEL
ncbi:MAG: histidine phosphatase family protein [Pseudodesulfovibrio sp.]